MLSGPSRVSDQTQVPCNAGISFIVWVTGEVHLVLTGGQLLYDVVLVSAVGQHESAVGMHVFPASWASLPPPQPSMLLHSTELSSLCHTANNLLWTHMFVLFEVPGSGRSPGESNGNALQHSCPWESHGQRSLAGYRPWGHRELDMPEWLNYNNSGTNGKVRLKEWLMEGCLHKCEHVGEVKGDLRGDDDTFLG